MKKIILALFAAVSLMLCGMSASADTYNNSAFIGTWLSSGATAEEYGKLTIDYCDSDIFNCRFEYKKPSRPTNLYYTLYQGVMSDTYGTARFTVSNDTSKDYAAGTAELLLYSSQVRIKLTLDNGTLMYDGWMNPQTGFNPNVSSYNSDVSINLNDSPMELDNNLIVLRDHTYVPIRGVFEACGINVFWDEYTASEKQTQSITMTRDDIIVKLERKKNSNGYLPWEMNVWSGIDVNTEAEPRFGVDISDIQPVIINNTSYMPLRAIAETFGVNVDWDGEKRVVKLSCTDVNTKMTREETNQIEDFLPEQAFAYISGEYPEAKTNNIPYFTVQRKYYIFDNNGTKVTVFNDGTFF